MLRTCLLLMLIVMHLEAAVQVSSAVQETAKAFQKRTGFCVYIGSSVQQAQVDLSHLHQNSRLLVHGLVSNRDDAVKLQQYFLSSASSDRIKIEYGFKGQLPHVSHLANVIVVLDVALFSEEELQRVSAPHGHIWKQKNGVWKRTLMGRPKEMGQWTHTHNSPDGNFSSIDSAFKAPFGLRWLNGVPVNISGVTATSAWVFSGNLCYELSINDPSNIGKPVGKAGWHSQFERYVIARDAFNGLPLWKLNTKTGSTGWNINFQNDGPLAANDTMVFTIRKKSLLAIEGESGVIKWESALPHQGYRILVDEDKVYATCWESRDRIKGNFVWKNKTLVGATLAFHLESGKQLWSKDVASERFLVSDALLYCLQADGLPRTKAEIVALDKNTGTERWRVAHDAIAAKTDLDLHLVGPGYAVISSAAAKATYCLSSKDGSLLWKRDKRRNWYPLRDGTVWADQKIDPLTGEEKGKLPMWMGGSTCSSSKLSGNFYIHRNGLTSLAPREKGQKAASYKYSGARPACVSGMVPANGMLYTAQNNCKCNPAAVDGFVAMGHNTLNPSSDDLVRARTVEKGPAFGLSVGSPKDESNWPLFRCNVSRSGVTTAQVPQTLNLKWTYESGAAKESKFSKAWQTQFTSPLTAPVYSRGRVVCAATDRGIVYCMNAQTGKELWRFQTPSRIDSSPSLHKELCLFGCHDGYVYALHMTTGALFYRMRVAPIERRMIAHSQVESVWPAIGSILLTNDLAYVSAGRSTGIDHGIILMAFKIESGETAWIKSIGVEGIRRNDICSIRNGKLIWRHLQFDLKTGALANGDSLANLKTYSGGKGELEGAIIDGTWRHVGNRKAAWSFKINRFTAPLMSWNEEWAIGNGFAMRIADTPGEKKIHKREYAWNMPKQFKVEAVLLSGDQVVFGGCSPDRSKGFVKVINIEDASVVVETELPAPVCHDGVSLITNTLFVTLENGQVVCLGQ